MRLVMIEWVDSHGRGDGGWQDIGGALEDHPMLCRSVGWLALDGKRTKVVAPHVNEQQPGEMQQGFGVVTIPTCAILSIQTIREPRRRARHGVRKH